MHVINFLIAICLPYISLFSRLAPPETIPTYFFSEEAAFVAAEFGAVVFYWAGFARNFVARGNITEKRYFSIAAVILVFMCGSKIILTLPYSWITDIFAFGLGVLSISAGQAVSKKSLLFMAVLSVIILVYSSFILIGMAWFGFRPAAYYQYKELIQTYIYEWWHELRVG